MRKRWKTVVTAAAVAVIALSVVAAAYGVTRATGTANGRGACAALMSNPQAVKDMQALRIEHQKDMQAWWDTYGSAPNSAAAQAALVAAEGRVTIEAEEHAGANTADADEGVVCTSGGG